MKNSEAVAMLKSLQRTYEDPRANGGFEVLLNKRIEALQLAIEAMSEVEALKHDCARILDLLSESVNGVTPTEEA